jgi:hypothetical protein
VELNMASELATPQGLRVGQLRQRFAELSHLHLQARPVKETGEDRPHPY